MDPEVLLNGETGIGNLRAKLRHFRVRIAFMPTFQSRFATAQSLSARTGTFCDLEVKLVVATKHLVLSELPGRLEERNFLH